MRAFLNVSVTKPKTTARFAWLVELPGVANVAASVMAAPAASLLSVAAVQGVASLPPADISVEPSTMAFAVEVSDEPVAYEAPPSTTTTTAPSAPGPTVVLVDPAFDPTDETADGDPVMTLPVLDPAVTTTMPAAPSSTTTAEAPVTTLEPTTTMPLVPPTTQRSTTSTTLPLVGNYVGRTADE